MRWEKGSIGFLREGLGSFGEGATLVCPLLCCFNECFYTIRFLLSFSVSSGMGLVSRGARVEFGCFVLHFIFLLLYVYG